VPFCREKDTGHTKQEDGDQNRQDTLLTREQLAEALGVSLRLVDLMLADEEITPMRLRGKLVRFYLPDVLQELRPKAKTSKWNEGFEG
jgi:excisionase family DNA binding protein